MKIKRVMIAAPKSGSGKTTVTCALLLALKKRGQRVLSYKCGPDYIDPMFHEKVIGVPSQNLDTFFTGEEGTGKLFLDSVTDSGRAGKDNYVEEDNCTAKGNRMGKEILAVMEGVMGLYDGLGGIMEEGSSYHLAKVTKTPIVLVVDAKGMGRSIISLIAGFLAYDKEKLIRGVILNRIAKGYYERIRPFIEEELKICALGFLPEKEELRIGSRHLGLILPDELRDIKEKLRLASEAFEKTVCLERIMEIAEDAGALENGGKASGTEMLENGRKIVTEAESTEAEGSTKETEIAAGRGSTSGGPVIAIARDEAFCFYYADNLRLLKEYGAEIRYFSPLYDTALPEGCHALLLGGGYPELYAKKLSENVRMRAAVWQAAEKGMPIVAECGGFLYLHSAMTDKEGISYEMAGVIPAACFYTGKLVRFGYVEIREKQGRFWPEGERIKGHEFHYYDSTDNGTDAVAVKPVTGKAYCCVHETENCFMGFPHLYYPSNPAFAKAFVEKAGKFKSRYREYHQTESSY